jgi:hypothetical protein
MPKEDFRREVERELKGEGNGNLGRSRISSSTGARRRIETAALMLETDKPGLLFAVDLC